MKKFFILLFALVLIFSMVACGNENTKTETENNTPPPTEEIVETGSVFDENFSLETTENFRIKIGSSIIQMPMNYNEFKNKYNFESTDCNNFGMSADDLMFLVSGKLNGCDIAVFLTPNNDFVLSEDTSKQQDLTKTSVVGISFAVNDKIELPFKVSENDTFESIQAKFGKSNFETESETCFLFYNMYVCKVNNNNFNVAFFFDNTTKKLTNIKCGDFVLFA